MKIFGRVLAGNSYCKPNVLDLMPLDPVIKLATTGIYITRQDKYNCSSKALLKRMMPPIGGRDEVWRGSLQLILIFLKNNRVLSVP